MPIASVSGTITVRAEPRAFIAAFARRIETGLLPHAARWRSRYATTQAGADTIRFRATDWWTAINVGLNDVELTVAPDGRVRYSIRYPRWTAFVVGWAAFLGVIFIAVFLALDIRAYIARNPASQIPGLSLDQDVAVAWAMGLFWWFVFPWLLVPLHRRPLRRLIERIIAEVDEVALARP